MDVLKPELIWIEGRCYRVNDTFMDTSGFQEHNLYEEEVPFQDLDVDEEENFEITMVDSNRYSTSFHVSKHYIGSIIGKKGAIKSRIERDTKTDIKIPRQGQTGDIVIFGPTPSNVSAARRRINIIVMSSRMRQRSTHFISIPLTSQEVVYNFNKFKEAVLQECPDKGIEESIFISAHKLHITVGVMTLMDNDERLQASKLLTEAGDSIVKPLLEGHLPFRVRIKGLSYMNDDPKEIDVLYGLVEEVDEKSTGLLQKLVDGIVEQYFKAGFMKKDHGRDSVKIHVTLINSKYRSKSSTNIVASESQSQMNVEQNNLRSPRQTFDGSRILKKFGDYDFGVAEIMEMHLSQRHSVASDGYYQSSYVINLTSRQ